MSDSDYNAVLCQIYVDAYFRSLFYQSPQVLFKDFVLTQEEQQSLLEIPQEKIEDFAISLLMKAKNSFFSRFAVLLKLDGDLFSKLFDRAYNLVKRTNFDSSSSYHLRLAKCILECLEPTELVAYEVLRFLIDKVGLEPSYLYLGPITSISLESKPFLHPNVKLVQYQFDPIEIISRIELSESGKISQEMVDSETVRYFMYNNQENKFITVKLTKTLFELLCHFNGGFSLREILARMRSLGQLTDKDEVELLDNTFPTMLKQNWIFLK